MSTQQLEVKLQNPNAIFESWLERWLLEAEQRGSKSQYKLREALNALKMYPLPLPSGKDCAILRGFGSKLCNLIDEEMKKQEAKAQTVVLNSSLYEEDIQDMVHSLQKKKKNLPAKERPIRLTKKQLNTIAKEEERLKQVTMSPGMFKIFLLVDTQETKGKNKKSLGHTRGYLESLSVEYEVRRLTVGDFLWIARDRQGNELVLPYIVERKRMDDLASSIRDGRFHEQKHRLKQSGVQNIIYLIEDFGDNEHLGLPLDNLKQALSNILVHNNFAIEHTENHRRSMMYLQGLTQMLIRLYKDKVLLSCDKEDIKITQPTQRMVGLLKFKALYDDSARNAQLTVREVFVQQLLQLHSLSLEKSLAIVSVYPTPRCLMDAYSNSISVHEARNLLANLRYGQLERPIVEAVTGMMGGKISHEYHYISSAGEDNLLHCQNCNHASNSEVSDKETVLVCTQCQSANLQHVRGIEVAHAFLLGDRYSKVFNATYLHPDGKPKNSIMGCYGIGISRILAAALEVLSTENELKWPALLAPYDVCIIGPKQGSKEQILAEQVENQLCHEIFQMYGPDAVHDDRKHMTIGKRLIDAKRMGYPIIVVVGSKACLTEPKVEVIINENCVELEINTALHQLERYKKQKLSLIQTLV